ncbi:MAG: hypothetical protein LQ340_003307 [Diploschistes diacapsis]|nr:MAG: hypothetical protein LQ340_003307 [Diploschistes diacapsis]
MLCYIPSFVLILTLSTPILASWQCDWSAKAPGPANQCILSGQFSWQAAKQSNTLYLMDNRCKEIGRISNIRPPHNFDSSGLAHPVVVRELTLPEQGGSNMGQLIFGYGASGASVAIPANVKNQWWEDNKPGNCDCDVKDPGAGDDANRKTPHLQLLKLITSILSVLLLTTLNAAAARSPQSYYEKRHYIRSAEAGYNSLDSRSAADFDGAILARSINDLIQPRDLLARDLTPLFATRPRPCRAQYQDPADAPAS